MNKHNMMILLSTNQNHVSPRTPGRAVPIDREQWMVDLFLAGNSWGENGDPHSLYIM